MLNAIPGMRHIGYVDDPALGSLPLYEMTGSINTLEGWNAAAMKGNRRAFSKAFGREPADDAELNEFVESLQGDSLPACAAPPVMIIDKSQVHVTQA